MNRIYKVIWNRVKNCYVVVSEIANNRGKINGRSTTCVGTLLCILALVGGTLLPLNTANAVNPAGTGAGVSWGNGTNSGTDQNNVAIGGYAQALGPVSLALGAHSNSSASYSTAIGGGTQSTAENATAIGGVAKAQGKNATAIGAKAEANGEYATTIGAGAKADNTYAIAIGSLSHATEVSSLAMGNNSKATNTYAYAIGGSAEAKGRWSIAMGTNAVAEDDASVSIGTWSKATTGQSVAVGYLANAKQLGATALGRQTNASAVDATAIGSGSNSTAENGTAIGKSASVSAKNSVAIGTGAKATNENAVALGTGSETAAAVATASESVNGVVHNFAGINPGSTVSVGKTGMERTVTNVAAGRISATSTDAINGSQLYAVTTEVNKGTVYAGDVKGTGATDNKFTQRLGAQTNIVGGVADTSKLSDNNIGVVSNGTDTLNVKLAKELKDLTSVTAGDTVMNTDGVTITGGPKIVKTGIDAGNKQIVNVASGGDVTTNGANIGDINRIITAKDKYVTGGSVTYQANGEGAANLTGTNGLTTNVSGLKNNYVTSGSISNDGKVLTLERNDTGKVNVDLSNIFTEVAKGDYRLVENPEAGSQGKYKVDSNGNMVLTVANDKGDKKQVTLTDIASKAQQDNNTSSITTINTTLDKGLNFAGDTGAVSNRKLGDTITVKGGATGALSDGNIGVESDGNGTLNVKLAKTLTGLDSVTAGGTTINNGGLTVGGKNYVSPTGINANNQKITNVANGSDPNDAVNYSQLQAAIGGTAKASTVKAKDANVTVTESTNAAGGKEYTVGLGNKITVGTAHPVTVDGDAGHVTGLTNTDWNVDNPVAVSGRGATEDQLKKVNDKVNTNKTAIDKGLNFDGDSGAVINKKLGEKLSVKGGATGTLSDGNIGVESDGNGTLNVKLAKTLSGLDSVTAGGTTINNGGLTVNGKNYVSPNGINANNQKITNVADGTNPNDAVNYGQLQNVINSIDKAPTVKAKDANVTVTEGTNAAGGKEYTVGLGNTINVGTAHPVTVDGNAGHVTGLQNTDWNVANPVAVPGRAATEDQLKKVNDTVNTNKDQIDKNKQAIADNKQNITTNAGNIANNTQNIAKNAGDIVTINKTIEKGLNFDGDSGTTINKKLGDTVAVKGGATGTLSDNNIGVVSDGTGTLNVKLAKTLAGLDSVTAGNTTINNGGLTVDGKNYVSPNGINANDQKVTNVANGDVAQNSKDAVNGGQLHQVKQDLGDQITNTKNDLNNKIDNTKTDLINKGLRFNADNDDEKTNKLGSKVTVNGDDNITTEITQTGDDTKIALKLKKDLNVRSVTATDTVKAGDVTMGKQADGANPGNTGNYITGLDNKTWDPGNVVSGRAATEDQLKQALANQTATGLKFDANVGGVQTSKLGSTVIVKGEGKAADTDYSGENIKTVKDANGNISVMMDKNLVTESVQVGKDGKDGKIGVSGKDGKDAVTVYGKDGVGHIGLTGPAGTNGKDGTNGIDLTVKNGYDDASKGIKGEKGVDGTDGITRIVYEDKTGEHQVATMEDGMVFGGDTGTDIIKKLNNKVSVIGGITNRTLLTTEDNIGVVSDGTDNLKVRLAKDLRGITSISNGDTKITLKDHCEDAVTITGGNINVTNNRITNLKDGEDEHDAVNKGQLDKAVDGIKQGAFGVTADDGKSVKKNLGETVGIGGDGTNISTSVENGKVRVSLNKDVRVDTVTANKVTTGDTTVTSDGLVINGGPSVTKNGIDAGNKVITNVAAGRIGAGSTDAVNGGQLHDMADSISRKGFGVTTDDGRSIMKGLGETVAIGGDGTNVRTSVSGGKVVVGLSDKLTIGSGAGAVSIDGVNGNIGVGGVSIGRQGGGSYVGGLSNTTWDVKNPNITSGRAATEDQLKVVSDKISGGRVFQGDWGKVSVGLGDTLNLRGNAKNLSRLTDGNIAVVSNSAQDGYNIKLAKDINMGDGTITFTTSTTAPESTPRELTNGPVLGEDRRPGAPTVTSSMTMGGSGITFTPVGTSTTGVSLTGTGLNNGGQQLHGVAAGTLDDDAVNVSQLRRVQVKVDNAGSASAALAGLHPLAYDPIAPTQVMAAVGSCGNSTSVALGLAHYTNENTLLHVGASFGQQDNAVNAGVTYKFGRSAEKKAIPDRYKAGPISSVYVMQDEVTALKAENARIKHHEEELTEAYRKVQADNEEMKAQIALLMEKAGLK